MSLTSFLSFQFLWRLFDLLTVEGDWTLITRSSREFCIRLIYKSYSMLITFSFLCYRLLFFLLDRFLSTFFLLFIISKDLHIRVRSSFITFLNLLIIDIFSFITIIFKRQVILQQSRILNIFSKKTHYMSLLKIV